MDNFHSILAEIMNKYSLDTYGVINYPDFSFSQKKLKEKIISGKTTSFEENLFSETKIEQYTEKNIKSIITIAFPYLTEKITYNNRYKISVYSQRKDYHIVAAAFMLKIISDLNSHFPDLKLHYAVDSSPVFEKEAAVISGIGSFGKNSLIYTEKYGSYIFLGEILATTLLPELKHNFNINCGNCDLCTKSCPNSCMSNDSIHSKRCISYLTQSKINFDSENIKDWLWGCDICQNVCPKNKGILLSPLRDFKKIDITESIEDLSVMSNKNLKNIFFGTPIGWSGMSLVRRNAQSICKTLET